MVTKKFQLSTASVTYSTFTQIFTANDKSCGGLGTRLDSWYINGTAETAVVRDDLPPLFVVRVFPANRRRWSG